MANEIQVTVTEMEEHQFHPRIRQIQASPLTESPMSGLTNTLKDTSLGSICDSDTPRRRLSMSSTSSSPGMSSKQVSMLQRFAFTDSPSDLIEKSNFRFGPKRTQLEMSRMNLKFSSSPLPCDKENNLQVTQGISSPPKRRQPLGVINTNCMTNTLLPSPDKIGRFSSPSKENIKTTISSPSIPIPAQNLYNSFKNHEEEETSQDSGYSDSLSDDHRFVRPVHAPSARRHSIAYLSHPSNQSLEEDGFESILRDLDMDENTQMSSEVSNLLSAPIQKSCSDENEPRRKPGFRRCLSMVDDQIPLRSVKSRLSGSPTADRSLKRADTREPLSSTNKRSRVDDSSFQLNPVVGRPVRRSNSSPDNPSLSSGRKRFMQRSVSDTEATIRWAMTRAATDTDLIGDFSVSHVLPLVRGKCTDLKNISGRTLADLIRGKYKDTVESFNILDCRYPYEYEGGHIQGARNLYTKDDISNLIPEGNCQKSEEENKKRSIVIFHCEFSSERGPNLCRFLRSQDREANMYPYLHFPEIYVLDGGYRNFHQEFPDLCLPKGYVPMVDPNHEADLKHFRAKSKSWGSNFTKSRMGGPQRTNLKRML